MTLALANLLLRLSGPVPAPLYLSDINAAFFFGMLVIELAFYIPYLRVMYWRLRGIGSRLTWVFIVLVVLAQTQIGDLAPRLDSPVSLVLNLLADAVPYLFLLPWSYRPRATSGLRQ